MKTRLSAFLGVIFFALTVNPPAHAALLLEPYLGYHLGSWDNNNGSTQNQRGVTYGGRIGYQSLGFMVGGDFMTGSWADNASPSSNSITPNDLGIFAGFNFPMFLRVYGVYDFSAQRKFSSSTASDTFKGSDVKLGVGLTMFPLISLNFEYMMGTFLKDDKGSLLHNFTDKMFGLTVSLPLTLF
jgi:hypothetical protein